MAMLAAVLVTSCAVTSQPQLSIVTNHFDLTPRAVPHIDPLPRAMQERLGREKKSYHGQPTNIEKTSDGAVFLVTPNGDKFRLMTADVLENARSYPGPQPILPEAQPWAAYINSSPYLDRIATATAPQDSGPPPLPRPPLNVLHQPLLSARSQGPRMTCVAFAIDAAMEMHDATFPLLSEEATYHIMSVKGGRDCCQNAGYDILDAGQDLENAPIATDLQIPYSNSVPQCLENRGRFCVEPPHPRELQSRPPRYTITKIGKIASGREGSAIGNPAYLEALLDAGKNIAILIGVAWRDDDTPLNENRIIDVAPVDGVAPLATYFHAVLLVGYDRTNPKAPFFIARNSFGENWEHKGFGYFSYDYIMAYAADGLVVENVTVDNGQVAASGGLGVDLPPIPPQLPFAPKKEAPPAPPLAIKVAKKEVIATFCAEAESVAVSGDRLFVGFPRMTDDPPHAVAEVIERRHYAFPKAWLQQPGSGVVPREAFVSVHALSTDGQRLWVLDGGKGAASYALSGGPKLVAIDLGSRAVVKWIPLPSKATIDYTAMRVSNGVALIATTSDDDNNNGITVVELATGETRVVLARHAVSSRVGIENLALSFDRRRLLYKATDSDLLREISVDKLLDRRRPAAEIEAAITTAGQVPPSFGQFDIDERGVVYMCDPADHAIVAGAVPGTLTTIETEASSSPRMVTVAPDGSLYALWATQSHPKVFALEHIVLEH